MADVINLRSARKAKHRADKAREAEANRAKFGQTKAEKTLRQQDQNRAERLLDGARLERDD
ncbi:DUF4169 family protein [Aurantiacibacter xanthus]|uniref:DUF4169 family protein n=1 Tax=Aurantiacibacter xanthus TaxID=1784712 RepID=A0A3A1P9P4_9SPHN|nr:DUF4169 family protein [Aurantiacibacter xanthus]RIV88663.1 DUF4169 family protein [Aurantiacibacter xanthus]